MEFIYIIVHACILACKSKVSASQREFILEFVCNCFTIFGGWLLYLSWTLYVKAMGIGVRGVSYLTSSEL